jgi:hypothetical protein
MSVIVLYYAYKAGRNCTAKAELANEVLSAVGARAWMQKLKGWAEPVQQGQPQITEDHVRAVGSLRTSLRHSKAVTRSPLIFFCTGKA